MTKDNGQFEKGHTPWIKGRKHKEETKHNWSLKRKGSNVGSENPFFGKQHTNEVKRKISESKKGKITWMKGNKNGIGNKSGTGKKLSEETKKKMSEAQKRIGNKPPIRIGEENSRWKGGITPLNQKIRQSLEYKIWRKAVFERDKYTCVWCGDDRGGNLEADHIKPFSLFPELRFAIDNGRTLCKECHKKTDTWGEKAKHYKYEK